MSNSPHAPSSAEGRDSERSSAASDRRPGTDSDRSYPPTDEADRVTPWAALALLYEVPARWVRAYLSDADDEGPWDESDREFLSGPFSTDLHPPDA